MTNPNPTPTPAETPQHSQAVASGQLQQPIPTTPPPAPATPAPPQSPTQPPASSPSETDAKPPEPVTDWKTHARTWEQRAKENSDKAAKYDEAEAAKRTQQENDAIALAAKDLEITQLREQALRAEVARTTGVPPSFITGTDEAAMRAAAAEALAWKGTGVTPEPPKTSAVPASTVTSADTMNGASPMGLQQLTREQFVALSDTERMKAVRSGQCTNLGIGVPKQQRRMGNQLELGANVSTQAGPPGAGQSIVP
jgi:hypothetical protein